MWRAATASPNGGALRASCGRNPKPRSMKRRAKSRCRKVRRPQPPPGTKDLGGRPRGSLKRFPFHETPLGFLLRYETPVVYDVLMMVCPARQREEPPPQIVEIVCAASGEAAFRKPKFLRYLELYRREGVCCRRGKRMTPERERYYEALRRTRLDNYIFRHWEEIERLCGAEPEPEEA